MNNVIFPFPSNVIRIPVADLCNHIIVLHVPIRHYSTTVMYPVEFFLPWPYSFTLCCCVKLTYLLCWLIDMVAGIKKKKRETLIRSKCWHDLVDVRMSKQDHYGMCSSIFMNYGSKRDTIKVVNVNEVFVISFDFYWEKTASCLYCQSEG